MASHRRTAAAAVATILASVSLYPVFSGMAWFWTGCATIIVVALAGTLARLRRLPAGVVVLAYAAALLLWLNLAFSNAGSLWHVLPTPSSLAALFGNAGQGFHEAAKYAPPAPELRGLLLLAAAGIGIAAALTDLIAVRLESAALAGLPLLLLFAEPFTLSVSRGFAGTAIGFCACVAGYLALLSSEGRDRIKAWEHGNPAARDEPDTRTLAAAGRRVGFASAALALCLPLLIPGLHVTRLFGGQPGIGGSGGGAGGGGGPSAGVAGFPNPVQQVVQELRTSQPQNVLTYTTSGTAQYLQIYTLDSLTASQGWQMFAKPQALVPVNPSLPKAPGLTVSGPTVSPETTDIAVAGSVGSRQYEALPVPYPATTVKASGTLHADKSTLMVTDNVSSLSGLKYTVTSLNVSPSGSQLASLPAPAPSISSAYLSVPATYDRLKPLAVAETAGAKSQFAAAVDLQNWLSGSFKYTLNAPTIENAAQLASFLEVSKQGYCQQFAYAMAVLARLLGIPARVALGFTSGTLQNTGAWLVTTHDAHAWPELYFQGYGWLRFEPTPNGSTGPSATGQGTAYPPGYTISIPGDTTAGQSPLTPARRPAPAVNTNPHPRLPDTILPPADAAQAPAAPAVNPWVIAGLAAAGLIVVLTVAPYSARRAVRRRRWRRQGAGAVAGPGRSGTDRADQVRARDVSWAHAAWAELRDDLMDYGAPSRPSDSPRAVAARAGAGLGLAPAALAALERIAMAEERARYAPAPHDGSGLRTDCAAVRRAIAAAVPRRARWRARLLPASVVTQALNVAASGAGRYRAPRGRLPWLPRRHVTRKPAG